MFPLKLICNFWFEVVQLHLKDSTIFAFQYHSVGVALHAELRRLAHQRRSVVPFWWPRLLFQTAVDFHSSPAISVAE